MTAATAAAARWTRSTVGDPKAVRTPSQAPDPAGTPARRAALRMLDAVSRRGEALDTAVGMAARGLPANDRALAVAIAAEVLRHSVGLDALIDGATAQPLARDAKAREVLRLALVQALVLGTPHHAAVATALPLVDGGPRRLVHGVLSRLLREGELLPDPPPLPAEVQDRWADAWGQPMVDAAEAAWAAPPPLDLSLADDDARALFQDAISLAPRHIRLSRGSEVSKLPGFADGRWWVQDFAASLPVRLLGPGEGRHIFDLCAAPGGKTMQLAAAGWRVTAVDQSAKRLERLAENLARTGLQAELVKGNVRDWQPDSPADAVLLDAPCSATGIFRRHPDVLHRVGARQIAELAELQGELLIRAANWVKPGGHLVYATCSLEPSEGDEQIADFLNTHPDWAVAPVAAEELPDGVTPDGSGYVRTLPPMLADQGGLDGFFIARLKRS